MDISQLWNFSDIIRALAHLWRMSLQNQSKIIRLHIHFTIWIWYNTSSLRKCLQMVVGIEAQCLWTLFEQSNWFIKPIPIQIFKSNRTQYVMIASRSTYYSISLSSHHLMNSHHFEYIFSRTLDQFRKRIDEMMANGNIKYVK